MIKHLTLFIEGNLKKKKKGEMPFYSYRFWKRSACVFPDNRSRLPCQLGIIRHSFCFRWNQPRSSWSCFDQSGEGQEHEADLSDVIDPLRTECCIIIIIHSHCGPDEPNEKTTNADKTFGSWRSWNIFWSLVHLFIKTENYNWIQCGTHFLHRGLFISN